MPCSSCLRIAPVTFVLFTLIQSMSCLTCYVCDSDHDDNCDDPFGNVEKYQMDCEQFQNITGTILRTPVCYKARGKVEYQGRSHESIERGCSEYEGCQIYLEQAQRYFYSNYLCQACIGHLCNGHIMYDRINWLQNALTAIFSQYINPPLYDR